MSDYYSKKRTYAIYTTLFDMLLFCLSILFSALFLKSILLIVMLSSTIYFSTWALIEWITVNKKPILILRKDFEYVARMLNFQIGLNNYLIRKQEEKEAQHGKNTQPSGSVRVSPEKNRA